MQALKLGDALSPKYYLKRSQAPSIGIPRHPSRLPQQLLVCFGWTYVFICSHDMRKFLRHHFFYFFSVDMHHAGLRMVPDGSNIYRMFYVHRLYLLES
jgi:hypothetical protein